MTLIEFIKSQLSKNTQLGDLAKTIQSDTEFPADKPEKDIISYLNFKTSNQGNSSLFKRLLKSYQIKKDTEINQLDLDAKFALLKTEYWKFYKEYFPVDKVVLVGTLSDFYKAFCIDSTNQKALFFDIKSSTDLNEILMVDEEKIHIGNLTEQVSVGKAISLLENCNYSAVNKPEEKRFTELIEFLKVNK